MLRTLDHLDIFLLIAGTYTPFVLIALRGTWGWTLFGIIWTLAAVGAVFELSSARRYRAAMVALYIAMGWVGLVAIKPLVAALPTPGLWLLFGGGVSYTAGVLFYRTCSIQRIRPGSEPRTDGPIRIADSVRPRPLVRRRIRRP